MKLDTKESEIALDGLVKAQLIAPNLAERAKVKLAHLNDDMRTKLGELIAHAIQITVLGHKASVPVAALELLSPKARQFMEILLAQNGIPVKNDHDLWKLMEYQTERESAYFTVWQLVEEANTLLAPYGSIETGLGRGCSFYSKPRSSVPNKLQ
jgi:hypothetical protein